VLLPALLIPRESTDESSLWNPSHWDWKLPAATFAVIAFGYAAYSSVGLRVFGFLGGYFQEEGMTTGTRYFFLELAQHILGLHHLLTAVFYLACIAIFAALKMWALKRSSDSVSQPGREAAFLAPAFALATALMFLFSPHYPWYILWLIPFVTLIPNLPILTYLMAAFYLFTTPLADGTLSKMFILNKTLYGAVFVATLIYVALRYRTIPGLNFHQSPIESRLETQRPS
jgi:alpha-1,6-mannosyltransferase